MKFLQLGPQDLDAFASLHKYAPLKRQVRCVATMVTETAGNYQSIAVLSTSIFTARIRRMGKVMFSVCSHLGVGGSLSRLSPGGGGVVSQLTQRGGSVSQLSRGGGVSQLTQPGGSVSWGGGSVSRGGGSAKIGQQNEYSLHGGRYASCVHAGGLSCYCCF